MFLKSKHLLGIKDLSKEEINLILETAHSFLEVSTRTIKKVPTLRGKSIVNFFVEPSTRTRASFELAAKRLSADVISITASASSLSKGESLIDTAKTLNAMKVDAVVIRHPAAGVSHLLAQQANFSVINAGDGAHEHPTQALLDLFTLNQKLGQVKGLKIAIVGDILHSRVARSNILAFTELGAEVYLVAPATLIPVEIEALDVQVFYSIDKVIKQVDVLYLLRLQLERQKECYLPSLREYAEFYGVTREKLKLGKESLVVMHPGPMNRGVEIASDVADLPISFVSDQVENGVAIRMALLYLLLGGGSSEVSN